jgi:hypothetical protein
MFEGFKLLERRLRKIAVDAFGWLPLKGKQARLGARRYAA